MLAVEAFQDDGFIVLEAEHAASALLIYGEDVRVQVLFTDVNMPRKMNGIDLAEHLKPLAPELQVIITSALPILRSIDHLPATFMAKPYVMRDVCCAAGELLAA